MTALKQLLTQSRPLRTTIEMHVTFLFSLQKESISTGCRKNV